MQGLGHMTVLAFIVFGDAWVVIAHVQPHCFVAIDICPPSDTRFALHRDIGFKLPLADVEVTFVIEGSEFI